MIDKILHYKFHIKWVFAVLIGLIAINLYQLSILI